MPNQKIELIDAIAIARGTEEPTNRDVFWLDKSSEGGFYDRLKSYNYDTEKWELVSRSSNELLTDLKTVDGSGSGLDSDTLRGYTPEQLISQGASGLPAMSTGKIIVGQGDTIGQAKTLGGIATIDANGSMAYVTNSISHTGLTDVGTNTHVQIDSHIADSAIHLSAAQATKLGHISVTQAVDLDQMETDVTANNAKVTNATHTGDVTGATALTIADDAVTNAKSANVATQTIKGRNTAGTGDPEDLTATQVRSIINVEDGATADQTDAEIETAYNNQVSEVTQAEAEAGTVTTVKRWTPERVKQAIDALGGGGGSSVYTSDGTLSGDRIMTMANRTFSFSSTSGYPIINNSVGASASGQKILEIKATHLGAVTGCGGYIDFSSANGNYNVGRIHNYQFSSGNAGFRIFSLATNGTANLGSSYLGQDGHAALIGENVVARVSTEKVSLQGFTVIKGAGTSTGSTLALYDNDSTPAKTWEWLDNGNSNVRDGSIMFGRLGVSKGSSSVSTNSLFALTVIGETSDATKGILTCRDSSGADLFKVSCDGKVYIEDDTTIDTGFLNIGNANLQGVFRMGVRDNVPLVLRKANDDKISSFAHDGIRHTVKTKFGEDSSPSSMVDIVGENTSGSNSALKVMDSGSTSLLDIRNNGDIYVDSVQGFTGTGSYSTFTIKNGIITSAS